ncbi:MAG: hypothetical protein CMH26_06415 [Micavibrio sp.]|nr:hypothetical protein [Micavibrio sp.]
MVGDSSSQQDLETLRQAQEAQCDNLLGPHQIKSIQNGFPPSCSILNPASLREEIEHNPETLSPIALLTDTLKMTYGEPQNNIGASAFNGIASQGYETKESSLIADLITKPSEPS